jgi:phosphate transport system substrate-binding protein
LNSQIKKVFMPVALLLVFALGMTSCSSSGSTTTTTSTTPTKTTVPTTVPTQTTTTPPSTTPEKLVGLNGAGATFPAPLYTRWFDAFYQLTGAKINYQAVGSGSGINQITSGTVDFGASDGIMTADQVTKAEAAYGPILHIPMTCGAVAVIYNIPGISSTTPIKLTGEVLADIYLKSITKWNDPKIVALNPDVPLPSTSIAVVHRSDGSGTTYIFTNYLSKVSNEWSTKVGNATSVNWPGDIGGSGSTGVAGQVQQIPGSIGYVELAYALQNNIAFATLKNASGNYITPTLASTSKAAEGVTLSDDMKVMLTNSTNPEAYPIVGFTWILVYKNQTDKAKAETLVKMLWWAIHKGQEYTDPLTYARLSSDAVAKAEKEIQSITYNGQALPTNLPK